MATKKITQGSIKRLIKEGAAIDLGEIYAKKAKNNTQPKASEFETIGVSYGTYGMNGALLMRKGKLYGIPSRSSALFYYV